MTDVTTPDFFERLELELRRAAARRPRRSAGVSTAAVAMATASVLALLLVAALALLGGGDRAVEVTSPPGVTPVGHVVDRGGERHTVVATGVAPFAGPWQMETYGSTKLADPETGEVYQPAGLRCLGLFLVNPRPGAGGGQCGEFPRTPGFSRVQATVPPIKGGAREILVYGRVPETATAVTLTQRSSLLRQAKPFEGLGPADGDYYLLAVPPDTKGRVNWLDRDGKPGSRGIELLPP
jgi:hypothetical protein